MQREVIDWNRHIYPIFTHTLQTRIKKRMATVIVVVGVAGIGKSHAAIKVARKLDPTFTEDQIVFTYKQFMQAVNRLREGKVIVFDEPSYVIGKRKWWQELSQAITETIESFRFKILPLIIPVIDKSLIDIKVREDLIQYMVVVWDRGEASVYTVHKSPFTGHVTTPFFCQLFLGMIDSDKCETQFCQRCPQFKCECDLLKAKYERKKAGISDRRYRVSLEKAKAGEAKQYSTRALAREVLNRKLLETLKDERGRINKAKIRTVLADELEIEISEHKARMVKEMLEHTEAEEILGVAKKNV
ncbi:MAG: hypothetical protein HWN68_08345 [Desulfobacterales bacterium]|nr:hypothetical protein [Desulfobacterales bacterium]